ncbi:hypothetical protein KDH_44200 [Dictyobacter sp. S3.2.2.5]|uniref:Uncharacterized protein n=1 Tax=Dictyobacter halimunensis TaxID=3026934 RepID=A0ABQ6FXL9_9CHLR|nr:hypothetical protein KDH_44200 [Dictyobacter sp. S3.2.2.5]
MPSTRTKITIEMPRINQNRLLSLAATGPAVFKIEGEFSPHAANRIEDNDSKLSNASQRFALRNTGILTSKALLNN